MKSTNSERHPGLGEVIFAVYGITRGMDETGLPTAAHRSLRSRAKALLGRVRRRLHSQK